jgi:hypothetical protein
MSSSASSAITEAVGDKDEVGHAMSMEDPDATILEFLCARLALAC